MASTAVAPLVAVIGATGAQGGAVARALLAAGKRVRAITRKPDDPKAEPLREAGAEVVGANVLDKASLAAAFKGAWGVFGVTTFWERGAEDEYQQGVNISDAANEAGVQALVFSSLDDVKTATKGAIPLAHFTNKNRAEQYVRKNFKGKSAFVYAGFYLQNLLYFPVMRPTKAADGTFVFSLPIAGDRPIDAVDINDMGPVAAAVFDKIDDYAGKVVDVAGDPITPNEIAAVFARVTGKPARYERADNSEYAKKVGPELEENMRWINDFGYFAGRPRDTKKITAFNSWESLLRASGWKE